MWPESAEQTPLRTGLTTGTCATACAVTAARLLLTDQPSTDCTVTLPKGQQVTLQMHNCQRHGPASAYAETIKDAGDDPDVTHGATVFTHVSLIPEADIRFYAAEGVGTVTRAGLALPVGEPAINPVPRQMIRSHLLAIQQAYRYQGGFAVQIGIKNGAAIAQKTMNPRLGIVGGLSILGTTGIVRPFSCAAYIASIHQGIDVARVNQIQHMAACTGNQSERFASEKLGLSDMALLEMGDFANATLKYIKRHPIPRLSIVGGFGKISKLAAGHKALHSSQSCVDFTFMAQLLADAGAPATLQEQIRQANTSLQALALAADYPLGNLICAQAWRVAKAAVSSSTRIDIWSIDRTGQCVGQYQEAA